MAFKRAQKCPYSVGQVIEFAVDIDPNILYARTTWARFAEGQATIGFKSLDIDFGTVGATGGKKGHKMTINNLIEHDHDTQKILNIAGDAQESAGANFVTGQTMKTSKTGQADPEPIPTLPPFIVTAKWRRTA